MRLKPEEDSISAGICRSDYKRGYRGTVDALKVAWCAEIFSSPTVITVSNPHGYVNYERRDRIKDLLYNLAQSYNSLTTA